MRLTIHVIDNFFACIWRIPTPGDLRPGHANVLHTLACERPGPIGTYTRWVWAISEALRAYEIATGEPYPAAGLELCPLKTRDLHGFVDALSGRWPNEETALLAANLKKLLSGGLTLRIRPATVAELQALVRNGDRMVTGALVARATRGAGVPAVVVGA